MKRTKRFLALALILLMMFGLTGNACTTLSSIIGGLEGNDTAYSNQTNNDDRKVVSFYNGISDAEIIDAEVLTVKYSDISDITEKAREIVDAGVMLYIAEPECSAEDISVLLSIPKSNTTSYQSELLAAYSIYKLDNKYVFANSYIILADESNNSNQFANKSDISVENAEKTAPDVQAQVPSNFSDVITFSEYAASEYAARKSNTAFFDHDTIIAAALTSKNDMERSAQCI